jgi:hypothetical protein
MNFVDFYYQNWRDLKSAIHAAAHKSEQDLFAAYHYYHAMHKTDAIQSFPFEEQWVADLLKDGATDPTTPPLQDEWTDILEQAAALGPDCQERVRQHKELADHPPSSVCCGAKAKHRERMLQRARDVIRSFQDGTAITDKTDNGITAETD